MNRKDFIKGSCGVCVALSSGFMLSAILDSCKTPLGVIKTASENDVLTIPLTEFEKENYKLVRVKNYDYDLAVQKMPDGTFETLVLKCTHAGHPLTKTGNNYYCTMHGSQFDHDGHVTKGPAEKDLTRLPTRIVKDNLSIRLKEA